MANAIKKHGKTHGPAMASYIRKKEPSSFLTAAREKDQNNPPRSLATALPSGALTRSAQTENEEAKQATDKRRPDQTSRQDLETIFAAKRCTREE
jgi:hypothetical protein